MNRMKQPPIAGKLQPYASQRRTKTNGYHRRVHIFVNDGPAPECRLSLRPLLPEDDRQGVLSADFVEKVTCRADSLLIQFSQ
jgi:hypothetical protein